MLAVMVPGDNGFRLMPAIEPPDAFYRRKSLFNAE
jgi:hypothetical protein